NKNVINIKDLIQNILYNYQSKALNKNINVHSDLKDVYVDVDKDQFSQVVINLLSNAIKYTNQNGNIYVKIYLENNIPTLSIKDTGIGIPKEDLKYIFERFYRVDKSRNKETGGIGVGLTIVKAIVSTHNGTISVYSQLGKGTEFIIKLPRL
ncbi:MAG: sensor histidine kinase, partial [Paraclostridium sp.]